MEKFARCCDITNKGMNEGWVVGPMELYIADEENLIIELRKVDDVPDNLSDDELREYLYDEDYFYHTKWEVDHEIEKQGYFYLKDGTCYVYLDSNEKDIYVTCPNCENSECHPIDEQRHHIQQYDYELLDELIDSNQVSQMKCHCCKQEFKLIWDYTKSR